MRQQKETRLFWRWVGFVTFLFVLGVASWVVISNSQSAYRTTEEFRSMEPARITMINDEDQQVTIDVRIADDEEKLSQGFANIGPRVVDQSVILVILDKETQINFNMKHVESPLQIAFISEEGRVIEVTDTEPNHDFNYSFGVPFRYVLEAPASFFEERGISKNGSWLDLTSFIQVH